MKKKELKFKARMEEIEARMKSCKEALKDESSNKERSIAGSVGGGGGLV